MTSPEEQDGLIQLARQGHSDSLGQLLEQYRNYLYVVAQTQINIYLSARASPSDIVQQTFLDASQEFDRFRGSSKPEFFTWLRRILVNNIIRAYERHLGTQKRDLRRQQSLDAAREAMTRSSHSLTMALAAAGNSPSAEAQHQELARIVSDSLAELPTDYRQVIVLRNLEGLPFEEVAERMGRSSAAVRTLWTRAIRRLRMDTGLESGI